MEVEKTSAPASGSLTVEIESVCGMQIDPASSAGSYEYGGATYHFCHASCLKQFSAKAAKFWGK